MKKKFLVFILLVCILVTGCGNAESSEEISKLNEMTALNDDSSVTDKNYSLSYSEEETAIYAQVSNRSLLDVKSLSACDDSDLQMVVNYLDSIDNQLIGNFYTTSYVDKQSRLVAAGYVNDEEVINSAVTDYLLTFFARTPYYWQRTKTVVRGIDSSSRTIVADVTYNTIDFKKDVIKDSYIALGDPDYERKTKTRYDKWLDILNLKYNNPEDISLPIKLKKFKKYYGEPEDIIESQNILGPTSSIYETGNQRTYNGLIDSDTEQLGGSVTVRYILVPKFVLGINLGVTCEHSYITEFHLDGYGAEDSIEEPEGITPEGYQTVTDNVYDIVGRYFKCLDESDYNGLYKLTKNFENIDKYYQDLFSCTYQKHDGFAISLYDITGTHITCGVTISTKERTVGSNMTFPCYTDTYLFELELVEDKFIVSNMVLLSRTLEGEPAIKAEEADLSGFSAMIDLNNDDRVAIEDKICNFSAIQLLQDTTSDNFSSIVDISMSTMQLNTVKNNMNALQGSQKVVFLNNYQQGTSNYAVVKCMEYFQDETNAITEAEVIYEFIKKGGSWYVYNYNVVRVTKLDTTNLLTTNCLCLVEPGKIVSYTSQINGALDTDMDNIVDTSVVYTHEGYTPKIKNGNEEQGLVKLTGDDITEDIYNELNGFLNLQYDNFDDFVDGFDELAKDFKHCKVSGLEDDVHDYIFEGLAVIYNNVYGRYTSVEYEEAVENFRNTYDDVIYDVDDSLDNPKEYTSVIIIYNNIMDSIDRTL